MATVLAAVHFWFRSSVDVREVAWSFPSDVEPWEVQDLMGGLSEAANVVLASVDLERVLHDPLSDEEEEEE